MENEEIDIVARYGVSKGWRLLPRSVLVEGTSDVTLLTLAAEKFRNSTGKDLLDDLAIIAAGDGDRGGTSGVIRELVVIRNLAPSYLSAKGDPIYRVIGLLDNDTAGQKAVNGARQVDASITEYRDIFRLHPVMPRLGSLDPPSLKRSFEKENGIYKGLSWELEDLIGVALMELFLEEFPTALVREFKASGAVHRELTRDGKSQLVRFCKSHADLPNLQKCVDVLHALRHYLRLPAL